MDKEIENALIPETKTISVGDRKYVIKKLSIKQFLKLSKFISKYLQSNKDKLNNIISKFGDGNRSQIEDLSTVLDLLDEKQIIELFCLLLDEEDFGFLENNINLDNSLELFNSVLDINLNSNIKKNLQLIIKKLNGEKTQEIKTGNIIN